VDEGPEPQAFVGVHINNPEDDHMTLAELSLGETDPAVTGLTVHL
jgi:hypothetical protein